MNLGDLISNIAGYHPLVIYMLIVVLHIPIVYSVLKVYRPKYIPIDSKVIRFDITVSSLMALIFPIFWIFAALVSRNERPNYLK